MIRINLLPFRAARTKENIRRQISVFLLSMILITAGLFYVNGFWDKKIDTLNQEIKQINGELTATTTAAREVDKIKKDLAALKKKTQVIRNLEKNRQEPVRLLDAMTQLVVAKRMWFTNFSDVGGTVKIKGVALDNKTVADFMMRLETSNRFSNVNLNSLKKNTKKKKMSMKSFEITCQKAKPKTASGKKAAS